MKRTLSLMLSILIVLLVGLTGCQQEPGSSGTTEPTGTVANTAAFTEPVDPDMVFWIVTEMSLGKPMAEKILENFQAAHPDLQIKLQTLSSYDPSMTEGYGPDVFLLPAALVSKEPLFPDVNMAMRDGAFADISAYYDADTELDKEGLVTAVMDAGVVDGARYVLPLRYDMPVLYVDTNQLAKEGGTVDMLSGTIGELYDAVLASDNPKLATAATVTNGAMRSFSLDFYPELIDYDTGEILLTAEDMVPLLQSIQKARGAELLDKSKYTDPPASDVARGKTMTDIRYWNELFCYYIGGMDDLLSYGIYNCVYYLPGLTMLPVTAVDGSVVADVTYYGAVGAESTKPELAYEFLRQCLTEECQWQENEDLASAKFAGWPVRAKGNVIFPARKFIESVAVKDLADLYYHNLNTSGIGELPILDAAIDRVQFATKYEFSFKKEVVDMLNDAGTGAVLEKDIETLVQAWLDKVGQQLT